MMTTSQSEHKIPFRGSYVKQSITLICNYCRYIRCFFGDLSSAENRPHQTAIIRSSNQASAQRHSALCSASARHSLPLEVSQ